jgi:ribosome-binding protein aMBF1 (putative translation factor)
MGVMGVTEMADARDVNLSLASQETVNAVSQLRSPNRGDPLSEALGRSLRSLRVGRDWSRKHVAERLRMPVEHIEGHERGIRRLEPRDLFAYAKLFGVRICDFFKEPPTQGTA